MLPDEADVHAAIAAKHHKELTAMTALHNAVVGMMTVDKWTIRRTSGTKPFTIDIIRGLLTKACKTFRSIQILGESGLHEDANALVRVLLETTVAVLFILQRRRREGKTKALTPTAHQRAIIFYGYSLHQQLKMLMHWKKTPGLKRQATKSAIKRTEDAIAQVKKYLPAGASFEGHWSGKGGFRQAVEALRADPLHAVLYRHTSAISHVSDVGLHFEQDPETGELIWQVPPRLEGFEGPSYVSRELLWMLANRIDERLGLGFKAALAPHKITKADLP
jgi:hypothetical protein